jgi:hypothetical protein
MSLGLQKSWQLIPYDGSSAFPVLIVFGRGKKHNM